MVQDASCPDFSGPIPPLVGRMDAAVDVVITGHTQQEYICQRPAQIAFSNPGGLRSDLLNLRVSYGQLFSVLPGSMRLHGVPIDMNAVYRVTVNSFMSSGGDSFNVLRHGRNVQEGEVDMEVAKRYFRSQPVLPAPEMGRVI